MEYPKRKQVRLTEYDYSSPGAYFVTICTESRRCILSEIVVGAAALGGPRVELTAIGKIVEQMILSSEKIDGIHVDNYVIMPNHIHMILRVEADCTKGNDGPPRAAAPTHAAIPNAVGAFKRLVHKQIGQNIFQRGYHEHVIRNERDYCEIWNYIDGNPGKWADDRYYDAGQSAL